MNASPEEIPVFDPRPEIAAVRPAIDAAIARVFSSGHFILGPEVEAFEAEVAEFLGVRHAVGVNSGTDAIQIALEALGVGPGDEVLTSAFSFFATAEAIARLGAVPVFADVDPATFNLDPASAARAIGPRTRALVPVHLFGQAADMGPLLALAARHGLAVVEDVAQAFGATWGERRLGSLGAAGAFSFFPSKNLGGCGDGGLVATNDDALAERARMLRSHGMRRKYLNEILGYNSRLDALQAALLRAKLPEVEAWNGRRREVARRYHESLSGLAGITLPAEAPGRHHVYHQYTVRVAAGRRDALRDHLAGLGIATAIYYPLPLHRLPACARPDLELPAAEASSAEVLSLPMGPFLATGSQERVCLAIASFAAP